MPSPLISQVVNRILLCGATTEEIAKRAQLQRGEGQRCSQYRGSGKTFASAATRSYGISMQTCFIITVKRCIQFAVLFYFLKKRCKTLHTGVEICDASGL